MTREEAIAKLKELHGNLDLEAAHSDADDNSMRSAERARVR